MGLADDEAGMVPKRQLNPKVRSCIYPTGFVWEPERDTAVVSYGINDFATGVRRYDRGELMSSMVSVSAIERKHADPERSAIRTFYWDSSPRRTGPSRFRIGNVGDLFQELLVSRLFGAAPVLDERAGRRFLGIGSIAHRALPGDVLWGTGFKNQPLKLTPRELETVDVRAVRGPLTRDYLKKAGVNVERVATFFDAGLLIRHLFAEALDEIGTRITDRHPVLLIPHYKDQDSFQRRYGGRAPIGSVDSSFLDFCAQLLAADLVVSSSLHGIVFAEALGVRALMHAPLSDEPQEKFLDYYSGSGRDAFPIAKSLKDVAAMTPPDLPVLSPTKWMATLPTSAELREMEILARGVGA